MSFHNSDGPQFKVSQGFETNLGVGIDPTVASLSKIGWILRMRSKQLRSVRLTVESGPRKIAMSLSLLFRLSRAISEVKLGSS